MSIRSRLTLRNAQRSLHQARSRLARPFGTRPASRSGGSASSVLAKVKGAFQGLNVGFNRMVLESQKRVEDRKRIERIPYVEEKPFYVNPDVPNDVIHVGSHGTKKRLVDDQLKTGRFDNLGGVYVTTQSHAAIYAGDIVLEFGMKKEDADFIDSEESTGNNLLIKPGTGLYILRAHRLNAERAKGAAKRAAKMAKLSFPQEVALDAKDAVVYGAVASIRFAFMFQRLLARK